MVDPDRLSAAYETARCDLLAESVTSGHWIGELSSSTFSTAAAICGLAIVERHAPMIRGRLADEDEQCRLSALVMRGLLWLARRQNADGGWGDADGEHSNVATTMLVRSAFALTCVPADRTGMLEAADAYIARAGGVRGVRRFYQRDRFSPARVLTAAALAGLVSWRKVPPLPFEWSCAPEAYRAIWPSARLPLVELVALGQAHFRHRRPLNPLAHLMRWLTTRRSLQRLASAEPTGEGLNASVPRVSFVVMALASAGQADHPLVRQGAAFLLGCVRADGGWPVYPNMAVRDTALAVAALASGGENVHELGCRDWLLACQLRDHSPGSFASGAARPLGGWSWSDRACGGASVDDTSVAILALAASCPAEPAAQAALHRAMTSAAGWLLAAQNSDGGWPALDRAGARGARSRSRPISTAVATRALAACRTLAADGQLPRLLADAARLSSAIERGVRYLDLCQTASGCWSSAAETGRPGATDDPVGATASVLSAYRELGQLNCEPVRRALNWLLSSKRDGGYWIPSSQRPIRTKCLLAKRPQPAQDEFPADSDCLESTAQASEALLTCCQTPAQELAALQGIEWLIAAVEANRHQQDSPAAIMLDRIGSQDRLRPLVLTVAALGPAAKRLLRKAEAHPVEHSLKS